jgi:prepilin-type N-terminal cleavage/methylation domain-containing protein
MKGRKQGFTLIEVMMSIGIMTVGAMGVLAMQQQLTRANRHAREISTATQIAQTWIERFKLDALRWTAIDGQNLTTYLQAVPAVGTQGVFTTIPFNTATLGATTRFLSPAFNYAGDDLNLAAGTPAGLYYCASHRLNWIYDNRRAMRVDVRVWWAREGLGVISTDYPLCADNNTSLNPNGNRIDNYHVVYLSTVIKVTP